MLLNILLRNSYFALLAVEQLVREVSTTLHYSHVSSVFRSILLFWPFSMLYLVFRNIIFDVSFLEVNFICKNLCFKVFVHSADTKFLYFTDLTFLLMSLMIK